MKKTLMNVVLTCFVLSAYCFGQIVPPKDTSLRANLVIKVMPIPILFEAFANVRIDIGKETLHYEPVILTKVERSLPSIFPSNQHLIKTQTLNYKDVEKIRRRGYLFLIPNRLRVVMKNGDSYIFTTWRRKKIIDAYKKYLSNE